MNSLADVQELARRFNEDEPVWRCYEKKRAERRRPRSRSPFSEHVLAYLNYLDWLAAEHRLTLEEAKALLRSRSQFVTLKRGQNLKYQPRAFTEHGAIMAAMIMLNRDKTT